MRPIQNFVWVFLYININNDTIKLKVILMIDKITDEKEGETWEL